MYVESRGCGGSKFHIKRLYRSREMVLGSEVMPAVYNRQYCSNGQVVGLVPPHPNLEIHIKNYLLYSADSTPRFPPTVIGITSSTHLPQMDILCINFFQFSIIKISFTPGKVYLKVQTGHRNANKLIINDFCFGTYKRSKEMISPHLRFQSQWISSGIRMISRRLQGNCGIFICSEIKYVFLTSEAYEARRAV